MPRPNEGRKRIVARLQPQDQELLAEIAIKLGYSRTYEGETLPTWGEFLEAIAHGDLILYKKVDREG